LVEKVIRALILLEGLTESGLDYVFKGGMALMLLFNSGKRLSINIDVKGSATIYTNQRLSYDKKQNTQLYIYGCKIRCN
jgi:hypothetical protein